MTCRWNIVSCTLCVYRWLWFNCASMTKKKHTENSHRLLQLKYRNLYRTENDSSKMQWKITTSQRQNQVKNISYMYLTNKFHFPWTHIVGICVFYVFLAPFFFIQLPSGVFMFNFRGFSYFLPISINWTVGFDWDTGYFRFHSTPNSIRIINMAPHLRSLPIF